MDFTCPLCGDYEGSAASVQAHISSKNDEAHRGKVGTDVMKNPDRQGMPQNGQQTGQKDRPGKAEGKQGELPPVECSGCGRDVKYPELMPYKATCPECGNQMRKRSAFEEIEAQADEVGNDETKGSKAV